MNATSKQKQFNLMGFDTIEINLVDIISMIGLAFLSYEESEDSSLGKILVDLC